MNKKIITIVLTIFMLTTIIGLSGVVNSTNQKDILQSNNDVQSDRISFNNQKNHNVKIVINYLDVEGNYQQLIKYISQNSYQQFTQEISNIQQNSIDIIELLADKLQIMKNYDLIPTDVTVDNIIDYNKVENLDIFPLNITRKTHFQSIFAPVFMIGMGFGLGLGYRQMPVFPRIGGNIFSIGVISYGGIICFDFEEKALFYQYTSVYPYLFHVLSGFIGIMMFAFDNIFPPDNGPPISFYSNFIGIGMAGLAIGLEFPPS